MKPVFGIVVFIIFFSSLVYSQKEERDSNRKSVFNQSLLRLQTRLDDFDFYRELNYMRMDLETNKDTNTIWMWTKLSITNSGDVDFHPGESPGSMIAPLHQQFIDNSKLNPVIYVLGMAQTAAVGYLAYRHIKKYGFFK